MRIFVMFSRLHFYIWCDEYWQRIKASKIFLLCLEMINLIWNFAPKLLLLLSKLAIELLKLLWFFMRKSKHMRKWSNWSRDKAIGYYQNSEEILFIKEFLKSPKITGAVYPSSKRLASQMAREVNVSNDGIVLELGAGTGRVTTALLKKGIRPEQLIVIEKSLKLASTLREKFPTIKVVHGDAANLLNLLNEHEQKNIRCIVSSLPFRSLPSNTTSAIMQQLKKLLDSNTKLIQFTYSLCRKQPRYFVNLRLFRTSVVWLNVPPAKVNVLIVAKN